MIRYLSVCLLLLAAAAHAKPIRVVVWDEQQPEQKKGYTNFLGNQIVEHLKTFPDFSVKSANFNEPEQGLTADLLNNCDVLVWWGHVKNSAISAEKGKQIVRRIKDGKLSLIALHSAHWSTPFVEAMNERARDDAMKSLPSGNQVNVSFIPAERFRAPKADAPLTPRTELTNAADGTRLLRVFLPNCCFPSYRADGAPSHLTTILPDHPIAKGIPAHFDVSQTEMYNEPFHVPTPDAVIFEEKWDRGERFRSGCLWKVGQGKVFYFRPGHETYPVYLQPNPLKILSNAVQWLGSEQP